MIDPHIWEDPDFNKLSHQARFLFIGMISNADDIGYLRGDAGSLKRLIFGFDEIKKEKIEEWIQEIKKMRNVHFYQSNNEQYAHFLKWDIYQKQQKDRIQPSVYPMCSICIASAKQVPTKDKSSKVKLREDSNASSFKKSKRFYKPTGEEMRFSANKWWVIPKDGGDWLEFAGEDKDIEFK